MVVFPLGSVATATLVEVNESYSGNTTTYTVTNNEVSADVYAILIGTNNLNGYPYTTDPYVNGWFAAHSPGGAGVVTLIHDAGQLKFDWYDTSSSIGGGTAILSDAPAGGVSGSFDGYAYGYFYFLHPFWPGNPPVPGDPIYHGGGSIDLYADDSPPATPFAAFLGGPMVGGEITYTVEYGEAGQGAPVPAPATMLLLGSGLIGLAGFRRKTKK